MGVERSPRKTAEADEYVPYEERVTLQEEGRNSQEKFGRSADNACQVHFTADLCVLKICMEVV